MPARIKKNTSNIIVIELIVILTLLSLINFHRYLSRPQNVLGAKTQNINSKEIELANSLAFWQKIVTKNPNYIDGWIEVSRISLLLGDKTYSKIALDKAISIDPNSPKIIQAQKEVASK